MTEVGNQAISCTDDVLRSNAFLSRGEIIAGLRIWDLEGSWNKRALATIDHLLTILGNNDFKVDHDFIDDEDRHASEPCCVECGESIYDHPLEQVQ